MSTTTASWQICPNCDGNLTPGHTCPSKTADELFAAAYVQYRDMVRLTILGKLRTRDHDLAEDLTQTVFLKVYSRRERIDWTRDMGGLLRVMAGSAVCDHFRLMRNTREVPADTGHWSYTNRALAPASGIPTALAVTA